MLPVYVIFCVVVYMIVLKLNLEAIKNPRKVWDRTHGRHVKNGEPTEEALESIRQRCRLGIILIPFVLVAVCFGFDLALKRGFQRGGLPAAPHPPAFQGKRHQNSGPATQPLVPPAEEDKPHEDE